MKMARFTASIVKELPRGYLPDGYTQPFCSNIRALMISGEFNPVDGLHPSRAQKGEAGDGHQERFVARAPGAKEI